MALGKIKHVEHSCTTGIVLEIIERVGIISNYYLYLVFSMLGFSENGKSSDWSCKLKDIELIQ